MAKFTRKAAQLAARQPAPVLRGGLLQALVELLEMHGFAPKEVAAIAAVIVTRWSKADDVAGAAEQAARTLAQFSDDQRVREVIDLGDEPFSTAAGRAKHRVVPVTVGDVYDLFDISERETPPSADAVIGYLFIYGTLAVFRVAASASVAGAIYDRRDEPTNLYTESLVQLLKLIRFHQEQLGITWLDTELSMRFSDDFTRASRFALEAQRMLRWFSELHIEWWLGSERQPRDKFAVLINQLRAHDAESKGTDSTVRTSEGIVDHLIYPDRDPRAESKMLPWRGYVMDPEGGMDPRKRVTADGGKGKCLATEFRVDVVPAVRAWLLALAGGATHEELAAICVAYRLPTVRPGQTNGPRLTTFDKLDWSTARSRADTMLLLNNEPKRLEPLPDADDPQRPCIERLNARRLAYLEAARTGIERVTYSVPKTAEAGLRHFGQTGQLVVRENQADRGYVIINRNIGFPQAHTLKTEQRTICVPRGTFVQPSRVLGLRETAISDTEAQVTLGVDILDDPITDDSGQPVPWERLGLHQSVFDAIYGALSEPQNDGGRLNEVGPCATALPNIPNRAVTFEGEDLEVYVRSSGAWNSRRREVWCRPAEMTGGWGVERRRNVEVDGENRLFIDGEDRSDWWRGTIQERLLLKSVLENLTTQVDAAFDHDVELSLPVPVGDGNAALDAQRRQLEQRRVTALDAAAEHERNAKGQDLLRGTALVDLDAARDEGDDDAVAQHQEEAERAKEHAAELRTDAKAQRAAVAQLDEQLEALEAEATQAREAVLDERWLSHFAALLWKLLDDDHEPGRAVVTGELLVVHTILDRMLDHWTVLPPVDGYVQWSCTATLDTIAGDRVTLPLSGRVLDTANGRNAKDPESVELLGRVLDGANINDVLADGQRGTTRESFVRRMFDALDELGVPARKKAAFIDHPHAVARQALRASVTGQRPSPAPWLSGYEQWIHGVYTTGTWSRSACPTDVTDVQLVAACLQQHPTGVEIGELTQKTGVTIQRIRQMLTPPVGGKEHIRRPAFFRWVSEGIVGLHPCPQDDCPAENGWASIVVLLPESNPQPGEPGGVLCDDCLRLPIPGMRDVIFPTTYRTLVTSRKGQRGTVRERQLTVETTLPTSIPKVDPPAGVTLPELQAETGLPRASLELVLERAGVPKTRRRRSGSKMAAVFDTDAARAAIKAADLDPLAYRDDALSVAHAAAHAGVTVGALTEVTDAGEIPVHLNGNQHRKWLTDDLDTWTATLRRAAA